ncbi:MAG: triose-phosphate isomerase [Pseudomonadota bacterium]|uniref:triose-phosphate isomerase n=1 Tax=Thermithiobacillus tepidarius TaxID=929 RepID=UPI00048F71F8|nr:triose-phosphate isomerase [Thermithiobacillus tepidarius]
MRQPLVAGNWKMNGTRWEAESLAKAIKASEPDPAQVEVLVCPPFTAIDCVGEILKGSAIRYGAQNLFWEKSGAYTGEVSGEMLRDLGCRYVILGHSERRQYFGETDEVVVKKYQAAKRAGLVPVVCVGETESERAAGQTEAVVGRQIQALLQAADPQTWQGTVVAYEPVWAIGTGLTATPAQAQEVHAFLRRQLAAFDEAAAQCTRILYGGSVKADNAAELFAQADIDGGLVGGASLNAEEFLKICAAAAGA